MRDFEFQNLIKKYQEGCLSGKEKAVLDAWMAELEKGGSEISWNRKELDSIKEKILTQTDKKRSNISIISIFSVSISAIAAACLLFFGFYYFQNKLNEQEIEVVKAEAIYPSTDNATITLENGEIITLNNNESSLLSQNGELLQSNGHTLSQKLSNAVKNQKVVLSTPKGKQISIVLDDGTKVWLNANSKLTYPLVFDAKERVVRVAGEAYFEVSHQLLENTQAIKKAKPFIVESLDQHIEVLGTKFNVKNYNEESFATTTLLSGSVHVRNNQGDTFLLKPNQEALLSRSTQKTRITSVDAEESISWKNNLFTFQNADLKEIMHEIQRWYDVDINIDHWPKDRFYGQVERDEPLSSVIQMIEASSSLRFKIIQVNNQKKLTLK